MKRLQTKESDRVPMLENETELKGKEYLINS